MRKSKMRRGWRIAAAVAALLLAGLAAGPARSAESGAEEDICKAAVERCLKDVLISPTSFTPIGLLCGLEFCLSGYEFCRRYVALFI